MGLRVAVFASGGGSNFEALVKNAEHYSIELLVSNRSDIGALKRAERLGIQAHVINPTTFNTQSLYIDKVIHLLKEKHINHIALAGYLAKIPSQLIAEFSGLILNIHPSLLPRFGGKGFYGKHVHHAVIEAKECVSGATVHIVDEEYDTGPILLQESIPVLEDDTPDSLALKILAIEHKIYPKSLNLIGQERVKLHNGHITILPD
ncbi:MAG: phosphoribosylglycinamide formyltransferase [Bacteroidetes bacterium]|nr:phosphoribosylglycinamide formyltransferase [Bacteroidota bacterium]